MATPSSMPRSQRVERMLGEEIGDAADLLSAPLSSLLASRVYARAPAADAEAIARDGSVPWPARRVAALILETLLSRIGDDAAAERRFWLDRLGLPTEAKELGRE